MPHTMLKTAGGAGLALILLLPLIEAPAVRASDDQVAAVQVVRSWVQPIQAGDAKVQTVIGNDEPGSLTLLGARTSVAAGVMIVHKGQPVETVEIPPRDTLGPHGFYLLLDDVSRPLAAGETIAVELDFADRAPVRLSVAVGDEMPDG